jgi:sortase A
MRRTLGVVGRVLVTAGLLLLLFVGYQLWGTGIYQARAQDDLAREFQARLEQQARDGGPATTGAPTTTTTGANPTPSGATTTTLAPLAAPAEGDPVGSIQIPRIGVSQQMVEGVDVDDLRRAPGHYPSTQMPGHEGNSAIAGHRTTYGAPFGDLDQLRIGDEIKVSTLQGSFTYRVTEQRVVDPSEVSVLDPSPDPGRPGHQLAKLTLTTCNPKYSAAERLVVRASLALPEGAVPLAPAQVPAGPRATAIGGLSGESSSRVPTIVWGLVTLAVGLLWWLLFHRHPRWTTWLVGAVPFLAALFVCYTYLERLLPSNY